MQSISNLNFGFYGILLASLYCVVQIKLLLQLHGSNEKLIPDHKSCIQIFNKLQTTANRLIISRKKKKIKFEVVGNIVLLSIN
jgi:hypothetical protein